MIILKKNRVILFQKKDSKFQQVQRILFLIIKQVKKKLLIITLFILEEIKTLYKMKIMITAVKTVVKKRMKTIKQDLNIIEIIKDMTMIKMTKKKIMIRKDFLQFQ